MLPEVYFTGSFDKFLPLIFFFFLIIIIIIKRKTEKLKIS